MTKPVKRYEVKGSTVRFACPNHLCRTKLRDRLEKAGQQDQCPECQTAFIVPGVAEIAQIKLAKNQKAAEVKAAREDAEAAKASKKEAAEKQKREKAKALLAEAKRKKAEQHERELAGKLAAEKAASDEELAEKRQREKEASAKSQESPTAIARGHFYAVISILILILLSQLLGFSKSSTAKTKWEYLIDSPSDSGLTRAMDKRGEEGWELVFARRATSASTYGSPSYEMIFKRPKS